MRRHGREQARRCVWEVVIKEDAAADKVPLRIVWPLWGASVPGREHVAIRPQFPNPWRIPLRVGRYRS
jgi:hypothetical protein